jgi:NAD(P)H dehydrogenase (quinone)
MSSSSPILVTGAAGKVGAVGRLVVEQLRQKGLPVRAMVRSDDERADALRNTGAEIVVGDLTRGEDVVRVLNGCRRVYFGMAASAPYLEATVVMAAAALEQKNIEVLVNISQMTVSQMSLTHMTDSSQQRQHWLGEQALNWSKLPVVHVRATVFLNHLFFSSWAAESIAKNGTIRLPFGSGRTSPVAVEDVARVIAVILAEPSGHIGKVYELTGPRSEDLNAMAKEYAEALGRPVQYVDVPFEQWCEQELSVHGLPEHIYGHFHTMAKLHAENRYDRLTEDVLKVTGEPPMSVRDFVARHPEIFKIAAASSASKA